MRKNKRDHGKISVSNFMQSFKEGQKVHLGAEPAIQKGLYHLRFKGKTGIVSGIRGSCYEVSFDDKGKEKKLVIHPVHLKAVHQ